MRGTSQRVGAGCTILRFFALSQAWNFSASLHRVYVPSPFRTFSVSVVYVPSLFRTVSGRCPWVPEYRCVGRLSELALSVLSFAFSHRLREVSLSVGAWTFS